MSVVESLKHACLQNKVNLNLQWIDADSYETEDIANLDGVVVPGGFGVRGIEGKISANQYIRENKIPILGICYGLQLIAKLFGGKIKPSKKKREFGRALLFKKKSTILTKIFFKLSNTVSEISFTSSFISHS